MSRRSFLTATAAVAAAWTVSADQLGGLVSSRAMPVDTPSTLLQTIRIGSVQRGSYRTLIAAAGEAYQPRLDILRRAANPARTRNRRSLLYIGHLSDIHIIDAQSPARLEPLIAQSHGLWGGAFRPQDTLTTHVAAEMVKSVSALQQSPVTGAALAAAFVTGDSADMLSNLEAGWYVDLLDGVEVTPNSGAAGYDGVQAWAETFWAYHPENPDGDWFGNYGFPAVAGLLDAAVSTPAISGGLPVPWYGVYGNHDSTYFGTFGVPAALKQLAVGDRKFFDWKPLGLDYIDGWAADTSAIGRALDAGIRNAGMQFGSKPVAADPARKLLEQREFMQAHFDTQPNPGPVGHGFTPENLSSGRTYWSAEVSGLVRFFGLDTCNQVVGADGAVPAEQFEWLQTELARAQADDMLAIVLSHHNSFTLENSAELATDPQRLIHADEFVATLLGYPNVVAWLNGHTHINTITPHRSGERGFWEITTASCVDFPQQQQMVELVDNRDGTLSIFTTVVDHGGSISWNGSFDQESLAGLSREFAANDWIENPTMRLGSEYDRNTELLLPAPFDLSRISDARLEQNSLANQARLLAWQNGWSA